MITSSGQLNAKQRELLELQALAQRRLKGARSNFSEGIKVARETKRDLEWTQKRVRWVFTSANLFPLCSPLSPLPPEYSMIVVVWIPLRYGVPPRSAVETVLGKPCSPNLQQLGDKSPRNLKFLVNWLLSFFIAGWNPRLKLHTRKNTDERRRSTPMTTSTERVAETESSDIWLSLVYIFFLMTETNWPFLHKIGLWESDRLVFSLVCFSARVAISGGSPSPGAGIYFSFSFLLRVYALVVFFVYYWINMSSLYATWTVLCSCLRWLSLWEWGEVRLSSNQSSPLSGSIHARNQTFSSTLDRLLISHPRQPGNQVPWSQSLTRSVHPTPTPSFSPGPNFRDTRRRK